MVLSSIKYHTTITTLPLSKFIDVVVDKNLLALVFSGSPVEGDMNLLNAAWAKINEEYADAIGDGEQQIYLQALKDVTSLKINIQVARALIEVLEKTAAMIVEPDRMDDVEAYIIKFQDRLNKLLDSNLKFDRNNRDDYLKALKGCTNRAKAFKIDLDLKNMHLEALEKTRNPDTGKADKAFTRQYFQSILITISDHARYQIGDDITVFQFCERIRRYNSYIEQMQKPSGK